MNKLKQQFILIRMSFNQIGFIFKILFIIALLGILNYESQFIPLIWDNKFTQAINKISVEILYGYITGFIFYFLIELIQRSKKRAALFRLINNNQFNISKLTELLILSLQKVETYNTTKIYFKDFLEFCKKRESTDEIWTWWRGKIVTAEFVIHTCREINSLTNSITTHADILDEKWINCLSNIADETYKIERKLQQKQNCNMSLVAGFIWSLYSETRKLSELTNKFHKENFKANLIYNIPGTYLPEELYFQIRKF